MTINSLPKTFVGKHRNGFKDVRFLGTPITQLDKDELMAIIYWQGQDQRRKEKQHRIDVGFLADLCVASRQGCIARLLQRCREAWKGGNNV